jgi:hypothetical protein
MTDTEILDWMEANHPQIIYANHRIYFLLRQKDETTTDTFRSLVEAAAQGDVSVVRDAATCKPYLPEVRP